MERIRAKLLSLVETPSDINEHLFTLMGYAMGCKHITEMGVRGVVSTWAFLAAKPEKLISIDIMDCPIQEASDAATEAGIQFEFLKQDTIEPHFQIEETDFLFIDTLHIYPQLKQELVQHHQKVKKYIALHDTFTFGYANEGGVQTPENQGLKPAVLDFISHNRHWVICNSYDHDNGLTILRNTQNI